MRALWVALFFSAALGGASAHDHSRPGLSQWFKDLRSPGGGPCCDGGDVTKAEAIWDAQGGHYRVKDPEGQWHTVPEEMIVRGPNLAGYAMVWWGAIVNGVRTVRCFMAGTLS